MAWTLNPSMGVHRAVPAGLGEEWTSRGQVRSDALQGDIVLSLRMVLNISFHLGRLWGVLGNVSHVWLFLFWASHVVQGAMTGVGCCFEGF